MNNAGSPLQPGTPGPPDAATLQSVLAEVFAASYADPDANLLTRHRLAVAFVFSAPDLAVLVDGRGGQEVAVHFFDPGTPGPLTPDLTFRMGGGTVHPFWTGELNVLAAVGQGKVQLQGSLIDALKIAPMMPMMQASYRRVWAARSG